MDSGKLLLGVVSIAFLFVTGLILLFIKYIVFVAIVYGVYKIFIED